MTELIPETSPLRRQPQNLHPRWRLILDGIRYSVDIIELTYRRLTETLSTISQFSGAPIPSNAYASVLADVWTIIDSVNRLRALVMVIPKAKETGYVRDFLSKTEVPRKMRNEVQHLHSRIDRLVSLKLPAWGTVGWVTLEGSPPTGGKIHLLLPASLADGTHRLPNPLGEIFQSPLDLITLDAHGLSARIAELVRDVAAFISQLQESLSKQFGELPYAAADAYISVDIAFDANAAQEPADDTSD